MNDFKWMVKMSFMFKRRPNQLFIGFSNSDTLEHLIKSITFATILFHSLNLSIVLDALFFFRMHVRIINVIMSIIF